MKISIRRHTPPEVIEYDRDEEGRITALTVDGKNVPLSRHAADLLFIATYNIEDAESRARYWREQLYQTVEMAANGDLADEMDP